MTTQPSCNPPGELALAAALNRHCRCVIVDETALAHSLEAALPEPGLYRSIHESRPHLLSSTAVFLARENVERMRSIVAAIEQVVATPAYRARALTVADPSAHLDPGARGVFLGYDFHLGPDGPQLIEINTNAGGALLNAVLARAARACCPETVPMAVGSSDPARLDDIFVEMFRNEWRAQHADMPLKTIAIADNEPATQYLYPEFRLFETLFRRHGLQAVIADASALALRAGRLVSGELPIDLVYNRLTDFALSEPRHAVLRAAYLDGAVVVTPHPRAYALYADKRNLTLLTDKSFLHSLELSPETVTTLVNGVPRTVLVTPPQAQTFWAQRRHWFFKPVMGFGSRAAYRGDKVTKRVFEEIAKGGYVAQVRVEPAERAQPQPDSAPFKFDLRCYVYAGEVQLLAARLYRGQTTNFRTPGGGFAPVFYTP
jgi:hypothetical protein